MTEYIKAVEPFFWPLLLIGSGSVVILAVLGWALTRKESRQFHKEYKAAKRGYYPDGGITTQDAKRLNLGSCADGCSGGAAREAARLAEHQKTERQALRDRWSKQTETDHVIRPQSAPGAASPDRLPVHPHGQPIPAPGIFYKDQQTQRRE